MEIISIFSCVLFNFTEVINCSHYRMFANEIMIMNVNFRLKKGVSVIVPINYFQANNVIKIIFAMT